MRTQGNNSNKDFGIVNLVDHPILFVDTTRLRLFKDVVFQVLHLTSACTGMLLKFQKHICNFLDRGLSPLFFMAAISFLACSESSMAYVISYSELINSVMSSLLSRRVNLAPG